MELDQRILEAKIAGFKPMADNSNVLTCDEVADWLRTLGRMSTCQSLCRCAEEYAHWLVVEEAMNQGWIWLRTCTPKEEWLTLVTEEKYEVLERFGFDRGTGVSPSEGAGVATLEAQMNSLQKTVDDLRAGEKTLEALKQNYEFQKMIDELREICAEGRAGAGTLEELMAPLQKIVDEMRAGDGPLEALKH